MLETIRFWNPRKMLNTLMEKDKNKFGHIIKVN